MGRSISIPSRRIGQLRKNRVLWCAEPSRFHTVSPPEVFLTAMPNEHVRHWLEANTWARNVPIVTFNSDDVLRLPKAYAFQEPGEGLHCVAWCPDADGNAVDELPPPPYKPRLDDRIDNCICVAAFLSRRLNKNVWELGAEWSGGLLALGAALGTGKGVAASSGGAPPALLGAGCRKHDVAMRVVVDAGDMR